MSSSSSSSSGGSSGEDTAKTDGDIEEWSDGDPEIRARNKEAKLQRLKKDEAKKVKRKSDDGEDEFKLKEPLKKKFKKLIVDSDEDGKLI